MSNIIAIFCLIIKQNINHQLISNLIVNNKNVVELITLINMYIFVNEEREVSAPLSRR